MAAWIPLLSRWGGSAAHLLWECRWSPLACWHVQVPAVPVCATGSGPVAALRACPVRVESGGGTARPLAAWPPVRAGLHRAVPAADGGPRGKPVVARGVADGAAAGAAGLCAGDSALFLRDAPAAAMAQG